MEDNRDPRQPQRETFLAGVLAVLLASGAFLFLLVLCGGAAVAAGLLVVLALVGLGFLNYLLWGRSLSNGTAGEREERQAPDESGDDWPLTDPRHLRRF